MNTDFPLHSSFIIGSSRRYWLRGGRGSGCRNRGRLHARFSGRQGGLTCGLDMLLCFSILGWRKLHKTKVRLCTTAIRGNQQNRDGGDIGRESVKICEIYCSDAESTNSRTARLWENISKLLANSSQRRWRMRAALPTACKHMRRIIGR